MANFDPAFEHLIKNEGGYVDDPLDQGGETYKGVSRRNFPHWGGWKRIDAAKQKSGFPGSLDSDKILQNQVKAFYKGEFWDRISGDRITDQQIAEEVFDTGVNIGMRNAARFLQDSINLLDRDTENALVLDGAIGKKTLAALNRILTKDKTNNYVLKIVNVMQGHRYIEIMHRNSSQERFARGWMNRVSI